MFRYFIQLAYNGTKYHGWQFQPNAFTVQEILTKALSLLLNENIEIVGAGRTDTGVHASFYVAHFETQTEIESDGKLIYKLNGFLPNDIRIDQIFQVPPAVHARFSATSRTYRYYISFRKEPFIDHISAFVPYELDLNLMNEAASILMEYNDFTSFSKLHTDVKTNNCTIMNAGWFEEDGRTLFEIQSDRFLRNMVRAIVGTLIDVGRKKITLADFRDIIEQKNRALAGTSVPAKALFLTDITYPEPFNSKLIRKFPDK